MGNERMTELDKKLQQMAIQNWDQFVFFIGENAILKAKSCLLRNEGKSYNQIAIKLNTSVDRAFYACKLCEADGVVEKTSE